VETDLIKGKDGIFDVVVDDDLIFSKHKTGRFPKKEEIIQALSR
jgi:selenoprotein W-related protein